MERVGEKEEKSIEGMLSSNCFRIGLFGITCLELQLCEMVV